MTITATQLEDARVVHKARAHSMWNLSRDHWPLEPDELDPALYAEYSRSQSAEDWLLIALMGGAVREGFFVEMGAFDGVTYSNSYLLEKALGWSGLLVEANPISFEELQQNRPGQQLVHAAVCNPALTPAPTPQLKRLLEHTHASPCAPGQVHFAEHPSKAVSGILEFMTVGFLESWYTDERLRGHVLEIHCVRCAPLGQLLAEKNVTRADVFSLDVEHAELVVLQTLDFMAFRSTIWLIESGPATKDNGIRKLLSAHGYAYLGNFARSLWFVHSDFIDTITARVRLEHASNNIPKNE